MVFFLKNSAAHNISTIVRTS